ncbi:MULTISPECIES: GNAT family protein [Burkholderiales]|uniref:hypothetical protein n=1 Tax=Burkholderiales TaxID=80840 RepID=UPI001269A9EA|nr:MULTISPECIES: hypothetical protein [Burkholderiales]
MRLLTWLIRAYPRLRRRFVSLHLSELTFAKSESGSADYRIHIFKFTLNGYSVGYLTLIHSPAPDSRLPAHLASGTSVPVRVADLYVESCYRNQGVGTELWQRGCAVVSGLYPLNSLVYGVPQGEDAARFWVRQGFRISGGVMFAHLGDLATSL